MITLLDTNVLIALAYEQNPFHLKAKTLFRGLFKTGWATCPLTENGFVRILGNPNIENGPGSTKASRDLLFALCAAPGHQFWPDSISLLDEERFPQLGGVKALTDQYLLALAIENQGRMATFDKRIDASLVPGGAQALMVLA
ncbi:TA system VapC family ribonuclease toxin [Roseibacillus persicicus]|uniref:DNA-binding protein n=1 Tax=Roseibacillus persicicus TaxID=454148 RepID=A0A918TL48_9BACT|nr:TA system VapC family ribonuclease toxin [Roseibacillus persicicus]GHC54087.1 DNA-binding protein [Roseibacillus persicicus]